MELARCVVLIASLALTKEPEAAENAPLLRDGDRSVTFALHDRRGKVPRMMLFTKPEQAGTAASINYWRDTIDPTQLGVAVVFKGIRFLRRESEGDALVVRLIGIKNEIEMTEPLSLAALESGERQELHFGPVTLGAGPISGTTEVDMQLRYDPSSRSLKISSASGEIEWRRLFADPQRDAGSLENLVGAVAEIPAGTIVLKPN